MATSSNRAPVQPVTSCNEEGSSLFPWCSCPSWTTETEYWSVSWEPFSRRGCTHWEVSQVLLLKHMGTLKLPAAQAHRESPREDLLG